MTPLASTADFTTGAVLSWALPIAAVLIVLLWWAAVLTIRAFEARHRDGS